MTLEPNQQEGLLDQGARELRDLQVDPALVAKSSDAFFAAFDTQAPAAATPRPARPWWHLPVGMAVAAAAAVVLTLRFQGDPSAPMVSDKGPSQRVALVEAPQATNEPTELGGRVALVALPTSSYVVESVSASQTRLRVQAGDVTVRLYRATDAPYELVVSAGAYSFAAMGTIYTVSHDESGPSLAVHEGEVWVRDDKGELVEAVSAGESWPDGSQTIAEGNASAERLRAHTRSTPKNTTDNAAIRSAPAPQEDAPPSPSRLVHPESLPQKWQRARLLRGQSKPEEALLVLEELAASQDRTWAPLAVIEQIRIHRESPAGLETRSGDILRLGRTFGESWGDHPLADEVRTMVCPLPRGHGQAPMVLCQSEE